MKHTKGSWQSLTFSNHELQTNVGMVGIGGSAYTIGDAAALLTSGVDFLEERDKLKAVNAELLEALKWMVDNDETNEGCEPVDCLGGLSWNEYNKYWVDGLNRARAAIAKAEGL